MQIFLVNGGRGLKTFQQVEDFAAEIFNADPAISKEYTGTSWTKEFMEYGCYCNKLLRGGGKVDEMDIHENLCLGRLWIQSSLKVMYRFSLPVQILPKW